MTETVIFEINNIPPPYDMDRMMKLYTTLNFPELVDVYRSGRYYRPINTPSGLALAIIKSIGSVLKPKLQVEVRMEDGLPDITFIEKKLRWMLGLDENLSSFYEYFSNDPVMSAVIKRNVGLRAPATETVFEGFVHAILEQQISFVFAGKLIARLVEKYGEKVSYDNKIYFAFPLPQALSSASHDELRALQISYRKAEYITDVSKKVSKGLLSLDNLISLPYDEIINKLTEIRGIGRWTAEMMMVRSMRRLDATPADDISLRRLIGKYYFNGQKVSAEEAREHTVDWGAFRGYASFYLVFDGIYENTWRKMQRKKMDSNFTNK